MTVSRLPLRPAPPHDPYSLLLAGWIGPDPARGFRVAHMQDVDIAAPRNVVTLGPTPDAMRLMTEASGSFGGLRPPFNVVVTHGGDIYLLERSRGVLRHLDPCCCRFDDVPCATRLDDPAPTGCPAPVPPKPSRRARIAPDRLLDPHGIALCDGGLWIADSGHARLVELALNGFVPRRTLELPAAERATLAQPWYPFALAFDGAGRLYVSDPKNARIDRFDAHGRWIQPAIKGVPRVEALAVDCDDHVYGVLPGASVFGPIALAVPASAIASFNAGAPLFDWQMLHLTGVPLAASLDLEVTASEDALSTAELAALPLHAWRRVAVAVGGAIGGIALELNGVVARHLYVRVTTRPGSAPVPAVSFTARGARLVRIENGTPVAVDPRADRAARFPRTGVIVDAQGILHLACTQGLVRFSADGTRVTETEQSVPARYKREGTLTTVALDAEIDGCQWHRVELCGAIPPGCSVEVRTLTSALLLDLDEIPALEDDAWCTRQLAAGVEGRWDCLVRSPPGRYLWLALTLRGDGHASPCIESITLEFPRVSLRRYLPAVFGVDPAGADFTDRFTAIFDATLRSIERTLDREAMLFDPLSAPSRPGKRASVDFLSWLASWVGISLAQEWPEARRRRYFKAAARVYCLRGTTLGLWRQLLLLLGFDGAYAGCLAERPKTRCVPRPLNCGPAPARTAAEPPPLILEHYRLRRWLFAGHGRLGDDAMLWGKRIVNRSELSGSAQSGGPTGNARVGATQLIGVPDPFHDPFLVFAHRFSLFVPARVRACNTERRAFERLLAREAPAHTAYDVRYVEPRFRVGVQAMIGLDSVVARTPRGVTLTSAPLGQGTVLSTPPGRGSGPHLAVGNARVGTTTLVD